MSRPPRGSGCASAARRLPKPARRGWCGSPVGWSPPTPCRRRRCRHSWCRRAPSRGDDDDVGVLLPSVSAGPILDPTVPFARHSCEGTAYDVIAGEETGGSAAFRPDDPDLADYVILDFDAFEWQRGSRADRQPPARPVQPHRRSAQRPACPHRSGRSAVGRVVAADAVVRDDASGAVLSAAR